MTPSTFIPGLELSRRFYAEAVRPLLDHYLPNMPHAAAKLGAGSDVLGFDTPMSMDHDWGPTVLIFLREQDWQHAETLNVVMRHHLPATFYGFPINPSVDADEPHDTSANQTVQPSTVRQFFWERARYAIDQPLTAIDWLTLSIPSAA